MNVVSLGTREAHVDQRNFFAHKFFLSNATRLYSGIKTPSIWFSAAFIHNSNILLFLSWMLYVFYAPKIVYRAFPGEHFLK